VKQDLALGEKRALLSFVREPSAWLGGQSRPKGRPYWLELVLVFVLAATYLTWFAWPLLWSASENERLVGTFNTDEQAHVLLIKEAIDAGTLRLGYIQYGYAYLNMALLPLYLLSQFVAVTEQQIIVWLRMIPTLFAIATVVWAFSMTREYFGRLAAWVATVLLSLTVLNFVEMAVMSHSDIPQVFFVMLGIYFCCRLLGDASLKWLVLASAASGLAFGFKYSGLFLLPVVGLCGVCAVLTGVPRDQVNVGRSIKLNRSLLVATGVAFVGVGNAIVPRVAVGYAGTEYFGVSMERFFGTLRAAATVAGVGMVLLAALPFVWASIGKRPRLAYLMEMGWIAAVVFAGTFTLTSPFHVFSVRAGFVRGFLYESLHSSFGDCEQKADG
jgi:4-amino-4-deoxy-L-arabinose transferase-like glycosyltransferase